jgi:hypothetical protein
MDKHGLVRRRRGLLDTDLELVWGLDSREGSHL